MEANKKSSNCRERSAQTVDGFKATIPTILSHHSQLYGSTASPSSIDNRTPPPHTKKTARAGYARNFPSHLGSVFGHSWALNPFFSSVNSQVVKQSPVQMVKFTANNTSRQRITWRRAAMAGPWAQPAALINGTCGHDQKLSCTYFSISSKHYSSQLDPSSPHPLIPLNFVLSLSLYSFHPIADLEITLKNANIKDDFNPLPSKVLYTKKIHFSIGRLAQKQKTFSRCKLSVFESKLTKESKF